MSNGPPGEITQLLHRMGRGDAEAERQLFERVHEELLRRASRLMRRQRDGHTLETAVLVNEAYLRLAGRETDWQDRGHFFAVAARAMRSVLVDHARKKGRLKRGGDGRQVPLDRLVQSYEQQAHGLIDLDAALTRLAERDPRAARIVEMRFFGGLALPEVARALGIGQRTAERDWEHARAWLHRELS